MLHGNGECTAKKKKPKRIIAECVYGENLNACPFLGTVVLESIANIHSALKAQKLDEHNSAIISAKQQAHQSLGDLIKLCDDALISSNEEDFMAVNKGKTKEIIENLDNAVTVRKFFSIFERKSNFKLNFRILLTSLMRKLTALQAPAPKSTTNWNRNNDRLYQISP